MTLGQWRPKTTSSHLHVHPPLYLAFLLSPFTLVCIRCSWASLVLEKEIEILRRERGSKGDIQREREREREGEREREREREREALRERESHEIERERLRERERERFRESDYERERERP